LNINIRAVYRTAFAIAGMLVLMSGIRANAQTGTVLGFGLNRYGQIGDNTISTRPQPTPAFYISAIKSVACGTQHTLALDSGGTVWAWGDNSSGQLGTGDYTNRTTPVGVAYGVKAIAAGAIHSLALKADGTVLVWGFNRYGQLGMGDTLNRNLPTPILSSQYIRYKAIAAGGSHTLLLADSGKMYGCGANYSGQLGLGDFVNRSFLTQIRTGVVAMAAGDGHTLIQDCSNHAYATGFNSSGQVGDGTTTTRNYFSPCIGYVRSISAGWTHSLALRQDGKVVAWGDNNFGALGTGDTNKRLAPTLMPNAVNIKAIAAGGKHSLLLTASGTLLAVGDNSQGQMGAGTVGGSRKTLAPVPNASMITAIAAGGFHSFAIRPFTVASATGLNNVGQLGIGNNISKYEPVTVANLTNVVDVATGTSNGNHSLYLRADGTVWASGINNVGQIGDGTTTNRYAPVQVRAPGGNGYLTNIIAIAAGDAHSLALAADGSLYTWGSNQYGQLALGRTVATSNYPVHVPYTSGIFGIAAGSSHTLMLSRGGQIDGCGWNQYGQLGLGHKITQFGIYRANSSGTNFNIAIAAGGAHSMSLDYSGEIYAWGSNYIGQLGFGDTLDRVYPTRNKGTLATSIACGGNHSLCTTGYGQAWGTGGNGVGELGIGNTAATYEWTYNPTLNNMLGVASGLGHTVFLNYGGLMTAAGEGNYGQLGNGGNSDWFNPTLISSTVGGIAMAAGGNHSLLVSIPPIQLTSMTLSTSSVKGGTALTGTLRLNGNAGPGGQRVYLNYYSQDQYGRYVNAASMPAYVDVAPASNTATFPITTKAVTAKVTTYINGYLNQSVGTSLTIVP
jgi:alpha-tubulin suppressor-like RCC1 family protein